jgi:hypothetical protein
MSRRHRSDTALPPKEQLRAHARSERQRVSSELHTLSSALGNGVDVDDVEEPGVEWKPVHHRDASRAREKSVRRSRLRHWKLKSWKRRTALRRKRAEAARLGADAT